MYLTASIAINDLRTRGFSAFEFSAIHSLFRDKKEVSFADDFEIIESYRFCIPREKGEDILVYGIRMLASQMKGILVSHAAYCSKIVAEKSVFKIVLAE